MRHIERTWDFIKVEANVKSMIKSCRDRIGIREVELIINEFFLIFWNIKIKIEIEPTYV